LGKSHHPLRKNTSSRPPVSKTRPPAASTVLYCSQKSGHADESIHTGSSCMYTWMLAGLILKEIKMLKIHHERFIEIAFVNLQPFL
jgi:hypothetical protein